MGVITYLVGSSVDGRQALLAEKMDSHDVYSILHLVPTRGRVMDLETEHRFRLKRKVNTLTGIIYIYFNRLLSKDKRDLDFPGIYRSIARFFSRLVRNNYQDMFADNLAGRIIRLEEKGKGAGDERYALESDLTWLFGDYEEIKREIRGYDEDDIISGVRHFLINGGRPSFMANTDVLVFDGYIHLSRIEEDILFHLFGLTDQVWWLPDYDSEAEDAITGFMDSSGHEENLDAATDLGKIRVIFPDLNDYSSVLFEILGEYGIPFSLTKGLPLTFHPISNIFQDIFRTAINHSISEGHGGVYPYHIASCLKGYATRV